MAGFKYPNTRHFYLQKHVKCFWVIFCILLTVTIGTLRYISGPEFALSLFYLFPVVLATWKTGKPSGFIISLFSAGSWLAADLMMLQEFTHQLIPFVNETFRLLVFLFVTLIVFKIKESLEEQKLVARTDPMTKIYNRRAFYELADMELKKANRFHHPLSIIYLDLDRFKIVNDQYGHEAGDILLQKVAECIKKNIRQIDILSRFGGDEFCILLSETGHNSAVAVAEKLKEKLSKLAAKHHWPISASIGIAIFESLPENVDLLVDEADKMMYMSKMNGRNRIEYKVISKKNLNELRGRGVFQVKPQLERNA